MAIVRLRSAPWGVLLALIALLTMSAISTWHGASIHDDDVVHAASIAHVHGEENSTDPDSAIHLAAHMVGQSLAVPATAVAIAAPPLHGPTWSMERVYLKAGLDPTSLLRPPQA